MDGRSFYRAYDDPYRVLAAHIVAVYPVTLVKKVLTDSSFVKSVVAREARQMDIGGAFLDCIDQEIISRGRIRGKNAQLKKLGEYYYSQLDLVRLRREIRKFAEEIDVEIPD